MKKEIIYIGRNITVTDGLKSYFENKIKNLKDYFGREKEVKVIMSVEKDVHKVDINVSVGSFVFRAHANSENMYKSIDFAVDKLNRRMREKKKRLCDKKHVSTSRYSNENSYDKIVSNKDYFVRECLETKPMSEEDALICMKSMGYEFYAFRNLDMSPSVIYKKNKGYGVISI